MLIRELSKPIEEKQVWGRTGKKITRKYRCTSGSRKGRTVAKLAQCFAAPNFKKSIRLKQTKARLGPKMIRKARRTKKYNPVSKRVQRMNKQ